MITKSQNFNKYIADLHNMQTDLYDLDSLMIDRLKKQKKTAKRKKIMWRALSGAEYTVGATFSVFAAIDMCNARYVMGGFDILFLGAGVALASESAANAKSYAQDEKTLGKMIETYKTLINSSTPEKLHEMAEIVRDNQQR